MHTCSEFAIIVHNILAECVPSYVMELCILGSSITGHRVICFQMQCDLIVPLTKSSAAQHRFAAVGLYFRGQGQYQNANNVVEIEAGLMKQ